MTIGVFLSALMLQAQPVTDCMQVATTQFALNDCAYRRYQQADRELNVQWRKTADAARRLDKAMADFRKPVFSHLLQGQRAWLTYRDKTCLWVRQSGGGSIAPMNYFNCLERMSRARTEELRILATDPNSGEPL